MKYRLQALLMIAALALPAACDDAPYPLADADADAATDSSAGDASSPGDTALSADTQLADSAQVDALMSDTAPLSDTQLADSAAPDTSAQPGATWVIDGAWLETHLGDSTLQVIDVRSRAAYDASRIPGALHVDLSELRATVDGIPSQVVAADSAAGVLAAAGVSPGSEVVIVGESTSTTPARLTWVMAYYGHEARLLDGGWSAWSASGRPTETAAASSVASSYPTPAPVASLRVDGSWMLAHFADADVYLVDARSEGEFAAGHIPGAYSVNWSTNISDGMLKPRAEVAALYDDIPLDDTVITYCASGTRASVAWLTLSWLGYEDVRLYDGSWAEWSQLSGAPIEAD